ncbi:MAG: hypothetical protein HY807_02130 [Nitrospirae bacterium]|nr:hypothetical protein [Nitrospirota bacterium]
MKLRKWLENWDMTKLKIKAPFLEAEWEAKEKDKDAAWEMYIELLTRIATQPLPMRDGDEKTALESVYNLFGLTRATIKNHGRDCINFAKIAVVVLNQIVRPFTAKWHGLSVAGAFNYPEKCMEFRKELAALQIDLRTYARALADMAGVENLTELEDRHTG